MDLTVGSSLLVTAVALGVTHGLEPDHLAGITALTHDAADPGLSAVVGGCFGVGHAALVVVWLALAHLLVGTTAFPPLFERVGMLLVGVVLSLFSLSLGVTGARKLVHRHAHDHGDGVHTHYHLHLPRVLRHSIPGSGDRHGPNDHDHGVAAFLRVGTVGALFTLSPPVSMLAFVSVATSQIGGALPVGVVAAYTATIVATMALVGGGAGSLFRLSKAGGDRLHTVSQLVASLLVLAVGVHLLAATLPELLA